ncbi:unnamed protein product, partial [Choristocarpus tenellus]
LQRTANFVLAAKGNIFKSARIFVESVLANIDRQERLAKESLKRGYEGGGGRRGRRGGDDRGRGGAWDRDAEKDRGKGSDSRDRSFDWGGGGRGGSGRDKGERDSERDRDRDTRDSRDRGGRGGGKEDRRSSGGRGNSGGRGGGSGGPFRDLENWEPESALVRNIFMNDGVDEHPITVILLIPNEKRVVGIVVGRHGFRLKKILDVSRCFITVENDNYCDKESGVRKVILRGQLKSTILAQQMIMDLVWEEMDSPTGVMQFMIPDEASSRIIGRGGTFIKQLQRDSGCKVNTLKDVDLRSGLKARVMNVCGTKTSMSKGMYLITRKIASRWEYAPEWEGGDPTVPRGQGLPA